MNLSVNFCGIDFPNPTVLASGYLGVTGSSLANCIKHGCGGVTAKSLFLKERKGHPNPTVLTYPGGMINAVGLSGEGIVKAKHEFEIYAKKCPGSPMIGSVAGNSVNELVECARIMEQYPIDLIELNFSCPNVEDEMGRPLACDPNMTFEATKAVKKVIKKPISVKLSPNVPNIGDIARQAEAAGADAITAINTVGPGMLIDIYMRRPILANKVGGIGGMGIKPIAIRCVYEIYKNVKIPIIGTGGISNGKDAIEMLMAGASLLGIGSALAYHDMKAFDVITNKIHSFMEEEGFNDVSELVGLAHEN